MGWCSDRWDKEHHPGGVHKEASRHFLVTPLPLLAVMRGGEFALFKMRPPNHISLCRPRWTHLSTTSATLIWTDVPIGGRFVCLPTPPIVHRVDLRFSALLQFLQKVREGGVRYLRSPDRLAQRAWLREFVRLRRSVLQ